MLISYENVFCYKYIFTDIYVLIMGVSKQVKKQKKVDLSILPVLMTYFFVICTHLLFVPKASTESSGGYHLVFKKKTETRATIPKVAKATVDKKKVAQKNLQNTAGTLTAYFFAKPERLITSALYISLNLPNFRYDFLKNRVLRI